MSLASPDIASLVAVIPEPFRREKFSLLRQGIHDAEDVNVYVNEANDFALLHPQPRYRYGAYAEGSRANVLGLKKYQVTVNEKHERRYDKIAPMLADAGSLLEIGAGGADFLDFLHQKLPGLRLASVEVDESLLERRRSMGWLADFRSVADARLGGVRADIVAMFHVLEHVLEPMDFLAECVGCLSDTGKLLIEVPSLEDPLLGLYANSAYQDFYFQRQHPFVYSAASLSRLLQAAGFRVTASLSYQRYGLENHLQWLTEGKPGGRELFRQVFADVEKAYRHALERSGQADTVIAVAQRT